jgi:voltage-gated potassium channel
MGLKKHHEFMMEYTQVLFAAIKRPAFIFLGFLAMTLMGFFSVVIHFVESPTNPKFDSYLESAYFTVSTMTSVGYGDVTPQTELGKIIAMAMMLLGTFIFVSFTGVIASTVIEAELEAKQRNRKSES